MRFSVRWLDVCAGEEKRILRKSAFWPRDVTEKRILGTGPHGKAHSASLGPTKLRFLVGHWLQSAVFREVAGQNALFREAAGLECAFP